MADSKKYDGSAWEHSLRKLTTATAEIEPTIYTDGTAITNYTIKGNTLQNGTPTPSNPVEVNGVGERTENLASNLLINDTSAQYATILMFDADLEADTTYTLSFTSSANIRMYMSEAIFTQATYLRTVEGVNTVTVTTKADLVKTSTNYQNGRWLVAKNTVEQSVSIDITNVMLNEGSTAQSYEPYGYKIPISSGQQTTNIYLSEQLMKINTYSDSVVSSGTVTYNIKKLVLTGNENISAVTQIQGGYRFTILMPTGKLLTAQSLSICSHFKYVTDWAFLGFTFGMGDNQLYIMANISGVTDTTTFANWLAAQYAAGTPVTVYYVLATAETETVTAPSIPTTEGANSITVDTTVQPSEFTATWTGWHDSSVKEYDGSQWQ